MPCAELNASNCKTWFLPWKLDLFLERRGTIALISVTRLRLFSDISALLLKSHTLSDAGFAGVRATIGSNGKFAELRVRRCSNSSSCRIKTLSLCLTRAPQRVSQSSLRVFFILFRYLCHCVFGLAETSGWRPNRHSSLDRDLGRKSPHGLPAMNVADPQCQSWNALPRVTWKAPQ